MRIEDVAEEVGLGKVDWRVEKAVVYRLREMKRDKKRALERLKGGYVRRNPRRKKKRTQRSPASPEGLRFQPREIGETDIPTS